MRMLIKAVSIWITHEINKLVIVVLNCTVKQTPRAKLVSKHFNDGKFRFRKHIPLRLIEIYKNILFTSHRNKTLSVIFSLEHHAMQYYTQCQVKVNHYYYCTVKLVKSKRVILTTLIF